MKEAMYYRKEKENTVECELCPHQCVIPESKRGLCGVRENDKGMLYTMVYGRAIAMHIDPVEKKPLYHFYPGTKTFSVATAGCNFKCEFCQNADISQISKGPHGKIIGEKIKSQEIVSLAIQNKCRSISYTYSEPTIFYEFAYDTSRLAHKQGLKNVFITNGYIKKEPLRKISKYLDAANVDIKSFSEEFYRRVCGAKLKPVLETVRLLKKLGIWVEVTTLIIPNENDSPEEINRIAGFLASVDTNIPWHISRFHPDYRMTDSHPTPVETLQRAYEAGKDAGLKHVYIGNVWGSSYDNTYCDNCGKLLIKRTGFSIEQNNMKGDACGFCESKITGVF